jgi:hypothetical protein
MFGQELLILDSSDFFCFILKESVFLGIVKELIQVAIDGQAGIPE